VAAHATLNDPGRRIESAVRRAAAGRRLVLAVSGGRDSMALMHVCARVAHRSVSIVATFDHGTTAAATRAASLVAGEAAALGFPVVMGHAAAPGRSEAQWRDARRAFLHDVARRVAGEVATAHTRDDQLETVMMRVLRDSGARGLAALYAAGSTVRPLLECSRAEVASYAVEAGARWVDDPTNASMRFLRNRVRRDLLPALTTAMPGLDEALLQVSRGAASWRERLDSYAAAISEVVDDGSSVVVPVSALAHHAGAELAILWPAIAARVGLAMDWRGTERAAAFTNQSRTGNRIQVSGGWEIARTRGGFQLRRWRVGDPDTQSSRAL
jgi:tRNA(Ile)-lysidine synthase